MKRTSPGALFFAFFLAACSSSDPSPTAAPVETREGGGAEASTSVPNADATVPPRVEAGAGDAAGDAAPANDASGPEAGSSPYPTKLSATGLFTNMTTRALGKDVRAYEPKYKLWSDGAEKLRWMALPPGQSIDTTDMDYWKYPVGTTAWKEFSVGGKKIETRMLRKMGPKPTDWLMLAYQWNVAQTDAVAVPDGVINASGTQHDIPSAADCQQCHGNMKDRLLGITAIQLSHQLGGVTLTDLISEGRLTMPPAAPFTIPGPAVAEQALGYLHANCGHCHNPASAVASAGVAMTLLESTSRLDTVANTTGYSTTVLQANSFLPKLHIIEPGSPPESELFFRISRRGIGQMPPLATEIVDDTGVATIQAWIESMPPVVPDAGAPEGGAGPSDSAPQRG